MSKEKVGCLGVIAIALAFFWLVGFIGNHSDWIRAKCGSISMGFCSAREDACERCSTWGRRIKGCWQEHKDRVEAEKEAAEQAEAARVAEIEKERAAEKREMTLREFALKESPVLWKSVVQMRKDIAEQDVRIESLRKSIKDMDEDPDQDPDYAELKLQRSKMQGQLDEVISKLKKHTSNRASIRRQWERMSDQYSSAMRLPKERTRRTLPASDMAKCEK